MSSPETDARRLGKFMARSARVLQSNPVALMGDAVRQFQVVPVDPADPSRGFTLKRPKLGRSELHLSIQELRPFFLKGEDCYLPSVAAAIHNLLPKHKREGAKWIMSQVDLLVQDGELKGTLMASGRLESDNGVGDGRLQTSEQVSMDYIYGVLAHEEEPRRMRLNKLNDLETIRYMVLIQMGQLVHAVRGIRANIERYQSTGDLGQFPDTLRILDAEDD